MNTYVRLQLNAHLLLFCTEISVERRATAKENGKEEAWIKKINGMCVSRYCGVDEECAILSMVFWLFELNFILWWK